MCYVSSLRQASEEISNLFEQLQDQKSLVTNKKVFNLALNQFLSFAKAFKESATNEKLTDDQYCAYKTIIEIYEEYQEIFKQNNENYWLDTILDNSPSFVPTELCNIAKSLRESASFLDPHAALFFDSEVQQWYQYHIIDLRSIKLLLHQKLTSPENTDPSVANLISEKLNSINDFLREYKDDEIQLPSSVCFSPLPVNYRSMCISNDDIVKNELIGNGGSAFVYKGRLKGEKDVAIKELTIKNLTGKELRAFQREITILATTEHPCLLHLIGATDTPPYSIVTEWLEGGSLYSFLRTEEQLQPSLKTKIAFDIARGMNFLHSRHIIHRDLKSLNVLLDKDKNAKICDFGISRIIKNDNVLTKNLGTVQWMAPELLRGHEGYDQKIDVYAYGIVLWEILTQEMPYKEIDFIQVYDTVLNRNIRPTMPEGAPLEIAQLIRQCWDKDPKARPSFSDILRRFKSGKVQFPGTSQETLDYIEKSLLEDAQRIPQLSISQALEKQSSLEEFVDIISEQQMEPEVVQACWARLHQVDPEMGSFEYSRGLTAFLRTVLIENAVKELRSMKPGSVPLDCAVMAVSLIPTGNEEIDEDLIITACKNGAAGNAVIAAMKGQHLKIALEVAARSNISVELLDGVLKRCNASLTSSDSMLSTAALRCILSMDAVLEIDIDALKALLQSRDATLKAAAFVTAAKYAQKGGVLPIDMMDMIAVLLGTEKLAGTVAACACTRYEAAKHILRKIAHNTAPVDVMLTIINQAAIHRELKEDIKELLSALHIPNSNPQYLHAVKLIREKIDR